MSAIAAPPVTAPAATPAAGAPPTPAVAGESLERWTTPAILWGSLIAIGLGALLFFLAARSAVLEGRQTVQTIGKDAAPSIIAARTIRADLADMDANAADALLVADPAQRTALGEAFDARRHAVAASLVAAARNITYGDAERVPIETMTEQVGVYLGFIAQARALAPRDPAGALAAYRSATTLMHQTILPAADALDTANLSYLNGAYGARVQAAGWYTVLVFATGGLLLLSLLATQVFLTRRTHRLLNPPLAGATLVAAVVLVQLTGALNAAGGDLRAAKQDAFDSVHALWQARSVAYDANGDQRRYLLDHEQAGQLQQAFAAKAAQLADTTDFAGAGAEATKGPPTFKGYLGDELRNITYPGEQEAALASLRTFGEYVAVDGQVRALEQAGRHQEAVDLALGTADGQSGGAFARFDQALFTTLDINQKELDKAVPRAFGDLAGAEYVALGGALAVVVLAWLGLRPRLSEYQT
jgi:hypothetical protein